MTRKRACAGPHGTDTQRSLFSRFCLPMAIEAATFGGRRFRYVAILWATRSRASKHIPSGERKANGLSKVQAGRPGHCPESTAFRRIILRIAHRPYGILTRIDRNDA